MIIISTVLVPVVLMITDILIRYVTQNELKLPKLSYQLVIVSMIAGMIIGVFYGTSSYMLLYDISLAYMFYMGFTDRYSKKLYNISYLMLIFSLFYIMAEGNEINKSLSFSVIICLALIICAFLFRGIASGDLKMLISLLPCIVTLGYHTDLTVNFIIFLIMAFGMEIIFCLRKGLYKRKERVSFAEYAATAYMLLLVFNKIWE